MYSWAVTANLLKLLNSLLQNLDSEGSHLDGVHCEGESVGVFVNRFPHIRLMVVVMGFIRSLVDLIRIVRILEGNLYVFLWIGFPMLKLVVMHFIRS